MICPRREEVKPLVEDRWTERGTCSWCGSITSEALFEAIEAGHDLTPTDKTYKVYVQGGPFRKFYFQHLDDEGRRRFVALLNERKIKLGLPGYFYVLPYFIRVSGDKT